MAEMKWKYEIGNRIIDYKEDGTLKRDLTIIDRKLEVKTINKQNTIGESYNIRKKYYKYHCNICGRDSGWVAESNLFNRKDSCPHRNVRIMEWKYEIEDNIVEYKKDGAIKRNLTIIDKKIETRKHARQSCINGFFLEKIKRYKYHCNICGWDSNWVDENNLCSKKEGCSCCNGKTVAKGINDVATTHPHLVEYFKSQLPTT